MWIAKNNDLIIMVRATREEIERDLDFKVYTSIEQTQDEYILINGEYVLKRSSKAVQQAKDLKIEENNRARDEALLQGVEYKNVLFDSDTDQKTNLLAMVLTMNDTDTIIWFGMDNIPLECNKQDLMNIGGLITALHEFCWTKNAEIKSLINAALTVDEVEDIVIDYTRGEE